MLEVTPHDIAHGGEAVARLEGKTYFVAGAMPGETVSGEVVVDKGNWARLDLRSIDTPSPARVSPPCPHFSTCGGCQWQYAAHETQLEWKRTIVAGQLAHLGGIDDAVVRPTVAPGTPFAYRNRMDFRVVDGQPALFRAKSKVLVPLTECLLLEPSLAALFRRLGPLHGVQRLTLRTGLRTGDALAIVSGKLPDQVREWGVNVAVTTREGVKPFIGKPSILEEVAGAAYRISGLAFFQNSTEGAEALVALVREAAEIGADDVLLDGYAGGGLFAVALGAAAGRVIAVESDPVAFRDLRYNVRLADIDATVVRSPFEDATNRVDEPWTVAVVDPPRTGLGRHGVDTVVAADPVRIVYVSCDAASLARDARLLADAGYRLDWATPVDMFPQTFHVETVARFTLATGDDPE
jgi:23S rRNA (uracil1939-C5)-methyltransferase